MLTFLSIVILCDCDDGFTGSSSVFLEVLPEPAGAARAVLQSTRWLTVRLRHDAVTVETWQGGRRVGVSRFF